jgi:hypothetical protein
VRRATTAIAIPAKTGRSPVANATTLIRNLGDGYGDGLDDHCRILREQLGGAGGREIDTQGDAFFFTRAREAVGGAVAAQRAGTTCPTASKSSMSARGS